MSEQGTLYVIATPIGNLADITLRALDTIKSVKVLYAEDTRVTQHLLDHYGIQARLRSLHDYNESKRISSVIEELQAGQNVGLLSDAGTPLISDPGYKLVAAVRQAGVEVRSIPGACALVAGLSIAGIPTDRFIFEGFLPKSSNNRIKLFTTLQFEPRTMIFYESPQRIKASIKDCKSVFGGDRQAVLLRELTKQYEEHIYADLNEIHQRLEDQTDKIRGEIVLILHGNISSEDAADLKKATQLLTDLQQYMSLKDAVVIAARHTGIRRNRLYSKGIEESSKQ